MRKQNKKAMTPAAKKAKRRKGWGTVFLVLAIILLVEALVLGIAMHETTILTTLGIEGLVLLGIGIFLRRLSKRAVGDGAEVSGTDGAVIQETEVKQTDPAVEYYKVGDILDDETRKEIYHNLDTLSRIYKNFFGEKDITSARLAAASVLFENTDEKADKALWLKTAEFLNQTGKMELAGNHKDETIARGEKAILDFFADK